MRDHVNLTSSSVVTMVTTGMNLLLSLFLLWLTFSGYHNKVMSNHKTHKSWETFQLDKARLRSRTTVVNVW